MSSARSEGTGARIASPPVRRLADALNIADLRRLAARRLPAFSYAYLESAADDGITYDSNRKMLDLFRILPRQLVELPRIDTAANLLGCEAALPFAICPTGYNGMLTHQGDLALAAAASAAGIPFIQSTMSTSSIEEVSKAISGGTHWFQLYVLKDPAISRRLMERAWNAGCSALVVTTDAVVLGNREADRRNYVRPQVLRLRGKIDVLMHPDWLFDVLVPHGIPKFGNLTEFLPKDQWSARDGVRFIAGQMENELGWRRIEEIRNAWPGKLVIKGILRPDDATKAAEIGADGIILSNHGGRQLDGAPSSIEQLPAVFAAAGDRCEILIDSGFRRGSDAFKALALGARGVLFGRAILYGLAAGRKAGASKAIEILSEELRRTMGMAGCRDLAEITQDRVAWPIWGRMGS